VEGYGEYEVDAAKALVFAEAAGVPPAQAGPDPFLPPVLQRVDKPLHHPAFPIKEESGCLGYPGTPVKQAVYGIFALKIKFGKG
jgi:hypothetical protein